MPGLLTEHFMCNLFCNSYECKVKIKLLKNCMIFLSLRIVKTIQWDRIDLTNGVGTTGPPH